MSTQVDSKPSTVLIESYNERISKFLLPESVHNATIVIGETDSDGVAIASITIPGKKTITTKVKRSNLETTVSLTNIDELDGEKFMCLVMEDQAAIESAANDITSAMGINSTKDITDLTTEQATELEENIMFSAAIWVNQGIFVPPFDFTLIDTTDEYTEYLANNDNIQGVFEVEAKPNSLGFVGGVKGVTLAQPITPSPGPTYSLDLDKVTNGDTPGQWTLEVDVESDEVPVASVLTELALTAVNNAYDTTITTADVTSNLEGKTLTIYTLKENASNVTGTLIVSVVLNITSTPEPETTEVEWSIVELEITSPDDMGKLADPDNYVVSTKTGLIMTDKSPINTDTMSGWLSAANYMLKEGETVRIKIPSSVIGDTFNMPSLVDSGITGVTEPKAVHYPFKIFAGAVPGINPYSLGWSVEDGYYIVHVNSELIDTPSQGATYGYKYLPSEGEIHYVDYTYRDGIVTININGIHTQNYTTDTPIIMIPLITGKAALQLGGVESFTSEYITNVDDVITRPDWSVRETDQGQPVESLPTTEFSINYTDDQKPTKIEINMDIGLGNQWSLRDSSGDEIYGHTNNPPANRSLVNTSLNKYDYNTYTIDLTDKLVKGEAYTLYANAASLSTIVYADDLENTYFIVNALPEGLTKLLFNSQHANWIVPQPPTTLTDFSGMFSAAKKFNHDISGWDVSHVTNMSQMFSGAKAFNQDISAWNVSNVTDMNAMFSYATSFNQNLNTWDTSNVTNMNGLFYGASSFNSDISNWDVSSVTDMYSMFGSATIFNQDISMWDTSKVTTMGHMFYNASSFNSDISNWDVSSVTTMSNMFLGCAAFNQDISSWNVSSVDSISGMFDGATLFNQDLSSWNVSSVTDMSYAFLNATSFNSDLSMWNVSNVTDMSNMFNGAALFNQDLSGWCVSLIPTKPSNFDSKATAWTLPKPIWGTCPRGEDGSEIIPEPIVKFDLSTITNGDEAGVWTLDVNEGDLSEVTAQSVTQTVLDTFNTTSDIQITYDQLDAVKEDTLVTVTPNESGSELLEGAFIITLNVITDLP